MAPGPYTEEFFGDRRGAAQPGGGDRPRVRAAVLLPQPRLNSRTSAPTAGPSTRVLSREPTRRACSSRWTSCGSTSEGAPGATTTAMPERFSTFTSRTSLPEAAPGCDCDVFAEPGEGVVPLEEMIATAGKTHSATSASSSRTQLPATPLDHGQDWVRRPARPMS